MNLTEIVKSQIISNNSKTPLPDQPLVSIIITCYNYGKFLDEAIESALNQDYSPIEIIVVNDGSDDNTVEVANKYPVRLVDQTNQGVAKARQNGFQQSQGKYCLFLDADDKLHSTYVSKTTAILEQEPDIGFVYTHAQLFGDQHGVMISREFNIFALMIGNYIPVTCLIRRQIIATVDEMDSRLPMLEDWDYWLTLAERGFEGKLLPEPLLEWRQYGSNSRGRGSMAQRRRAVLQIHRKHPSLFTPLKTIQVILARQKNKLVNSIIEMILWPLAKFNPEQYDRLRVYWLSCLTTMLVVVKNYPVSTNGETRNLFLVDG